MKLGASALVHRLHGFSRRGSTRATSWSMLGQLTAILSSTANFLLLARVVGPQQYGLIAGAWALVLAVAPVAALGSDRLIVRDVSAGATAPSRALGHALVTAATGWAVVVGGLLALHSMLLPQTPIALIAYLAVADIVALQTVTIITALCFATRNARAAGICTITVHLTKLLAVVVFVLTGGDDPVRWAMTYAVLSVLSTAVQLGFAVRRFGRPSARGFHPLRRAREGLPYSGNVVATVVQNDADKTLLVRHGLVVEAGHYSVAYRLASMAYLPVLAVLQAAFPRFFALGGEGGLPATTALARRMALPLLAYAGVAALGLAVCAPVVPVLIGEEYRDSVGLLTLLAPLVVVKVVQSLAGDALTGAGRQHTRTVCVGTAAAVNVAVNLVLIPTMGLTGALVATFTAEVLQAALLLLSIRTGLRRARGAPQPGPRQPAGSATADPSA
ncbi:polysaccharide biosynthesis C-terminal domain-containing protein [Paenibacillus sp. TRM 82003]|uniref:lipopolysaccharide biosynthesis protein n=1 Tax=Kineococcus sp. TRM81007 TaxID=2925831 RepID=UPI001F58B9F4|nr:polysaccharide biosynthesis C-terminal domain-containing protein [Kineococcus sp. TRM81007]MCI2238420.1 polysaccharide biosynthesis C-terminal domain-containing protein [Kineococcus sp. TRM81007]MCI3922067.1 polysaccharide biosynthesis C-terminal domain-containing protein [Paenibacillus sp. TRM 82003]